MRKAEALLPLLALAACGRGGEAGPPLRHIDCALAGAAGFKPDCTVEEVMQNGRTMLVVAAPDGMFRRFEKVADGRGVIAADGVEESLAHWVADGVLEVSVGQDRYRFPASLKGDTGPSDAATP
ncbi:hypothetical protein [Novosphingobium huizhouense]|uniref:hypothetical protein n=1 Tax=Novosphingobium huizhouense TaxID=2866625 RepID=UPI001CD8AA70|nr:hypothetical protein [Novosphingobium huizhouense]